MKKESINMKYYIGADHAGIDIKAYVKELFEKRGHEVIDLGPFSKSRVDYPDFAAKVCESVLANENSKGILICGSGLGMSMAANKVQKWPENTMMQMLFV